jgi:hypothetical protein
LSSTTSFVIQQLFLSFRSVAKESAVAFVVVLAIASASVFVLFLLLPSPLFVLVSF